MVFERFAVFDELFAGAGFSEGLAGFCCEGVELVLELGLLALEAGHFLGGFGELGEVFGDGWFFGFDVLGGEAFDELFDDRVEDVFVVDAALAPEAEEVGDLLNKIRVLAPTPQLPNQRQNIRLNLLDKDPQLLILTLLHNIVHHVHHARHPRLVLILEMLDKHVFPGLHQRRNIGRRLLAQLEKIIAAAHNRVRRRPHHGEHLRDFLLVDGYSSLHFYENIVRLAFLGAEIAEKGEYLKRI